MQKEGKIDLDNIRADTTVVETNIHYPTDSSLLWDTYRTIDRLWTKALEGGLRPILPDFRFHAEKIRKLHVAITRLANSKSREGQKKFNDHLEMLIDRTAKALAKAKVIVNRECFPFSGILCGVANRILSLFFNAFPTICFVEAS